MPGIQRCPARILPYSVDQRHGQRGAGAQAEFPHLAAADIVVQLSTVQGNIESIFRRQTRHFAQCGQGIDHRLEQPEIFRSVLIQPQQPAIIANSEPGGMLRYGSSKSPAFPGIHRIDIYANTPIHGNGQSGRTFKYRVFTEQHHFTRGRCRGLQVEFTKIPPLVRLCGDPRPHSKSRFPDGRLVAHHQKKIPVASPRAGAHDFQLDR